MLPGLLLNKFTRQRKYALAYRGKLYNYRSRLHPNLASTCANKASTCANKASTCANKYWLHDISLLSEL